LYAIYIFPDSCKFYIFNKIPIINVEINVPIINERIYIGIFDTSGIVNMPPIGAGMAIKAAVNPHATAAPVIIEGNICFGLEIAKGIVLSAI
ncbi:MAG: hypothetical protein QJR05_14755, partial [Thermoanaerobacterium sp.]|nr:hypothetical protein [Thermoanaerobacterium sp.]